MSPRCIVTYGNKINIDILQFVASTARILLQDIRLATQQVVQNFTTWPCMPCLWRQCCIRVTQWVSILLSYSMIVALHQPFLPILQVTIKKQLNHQLFAKLRLLFAAKRSPCLLTIMSLHYLITHTTKRFKHEDQKFQIRQRKREEKRGKNIFPADSSSSLSET